MLHLPGVFDHLLGEEISAVGLLQKRVAFIFFVSKDAAHRTFRLSADALGGDFEPHQFLHDCVLAHTAEVVGKYHIESRPLVLGEFDDKLWVVAVEKVKVMPDGRLLFRFKDGTEIEVSQ